MQIQSQKCEEKGSSQFSTIELKVIMRGLGFDEATLDSDLAVFNDQNYILKKGNIQDGSIRRMKFFVPYVP